MPNSPRRYMPRNGGGTTYRPRERRGTAKARGYNDGWEELRDSYRSEHPLCEDCLDQGHLPRGNYYVEVDHVIPFVGLDDPLRLDPENLRTRCRKHHGLKTKRLDGPTRAFYDKQRAAYGEDRAKELTLAKYREALAEDPKNLPAPSGGRGL